MNLKAPPITVVIYMLPLTWILINIGGFRGNLPEGARVEKYVFVIFLMGAENRKNNTHKKQGQDCIVLCIKCATSPRFQALGQTNEKKKKKRKLSNQL